MADTPQQCLTLDWVFGLNRDFKGVVHNLSDGNRKAIFYFVAHTAIIYDVTSHQQKLLQGHRNPIIASAVSSNRRFVVTADAGDDCMMIVWDTYSCLPVKFIPVQDYGGVLSCDISFDASYIVTLSKQSPQTISLWAWTSEELNGPELTETITAKDEQNCVKFSPDDAHLVVTNGAKRVVFWSWSESKWKFYAPPISAKEVKQTIGNFTQSVFVPVLPSRALQLSTATCCCGTPCAATR
jgi:WD40 repeat protein